MDVRCESSDVTHAFTCVSVREERFVNVKMHTWEELIQECL